MKIICSVCAHEMTKAEILGHLTGEALSLYNKYLDLCLATQKQSAQNLVTTRGVMTDIASFLNNLMIGFVNYEKIECCVCHKFTKWTTQQELILAEVQINKISQKEEAI